MSNYLLGNEDGTRMARSMGQQGLKLLVSALRRQMVSDLGLHELLGPSRYRDGFTDAALRVCREHWKGEGEIREWRANEGPGCDADPQAD